MSLLGRSDDGVARKSCFVIAPIGAEGSETRRRTDQLVRHVVVPVAQALGYCVSRADELPDPGVITTQIVNHLQDDDLVVADLTDRNPNVFYELAIRHASAKPAVQFIEKSQTLPFDIAGLRAILVDLRDLDSVEKAKTSLRESILAIERDPGGSQSPLSAARNVLALQKSGRHEDRQAAVIGQAVQDLGVLCSQVLGELRQFREEVIATKTTLPRDTGVHLQFLMSKFHSFARRAAERKDDELRAYAISFLELARQLGGGELCVDAEECLSEVQKTPSAKATKRRSHPGKELKDPVGNTCKA